MVSLLRRNRVEKESKKQRPVTRSLISDQLRPQSSNEIEHEHELYNDSSLDSSMFAHSLGLISKHHLASPKPMMCLLKEQSKLQQQKQQKQQLKQGENQKIKQEIKQEQGLEFHCKFCGKGYRWKSTMRRHEMLECGNKPPSFQCPECAYKARQRGNLTVHIKRHHQKNNN